MGAVKIGPYSINDNAHRTLERLYETAFGPSPALYRQMALCGWRPLIDHRLSGAQLHRPCSEDGTVRDNWRPSRIAIHETEEEITIEVPLHGIIEESLHLAIAGKMIIIRGELDAMVTPAEARGPNITGGSRFQHIIKLPPTINAGGFRAQVVDDTVRIYFAKRH